MFKNRNKEHWRNGQRNWGGIDRLWLLTPWKMAGLKIEKTSSDVHLEVVVKGTWRPQKEHSVDAMLNGTSGKCWVRWCWRCKKTQKNAGRWRVRGDGDQSWTDWRVQSILMTPVLYFLNMLINMNTLPCS